MKQAIGELVQVQRAAVGLTLDQVAEQAHVPLETLQSFEEGRGKITAAALERIAYVLAIDADALQEGRLERTPTAALFFRQGAFPDFRDDADRPKVAEAFERALALVEVNAILGRPAGLRSRFSVETPTPEAAKDGYRLANQVRMTLGNETDPLPDMAALLEDRFDILVRMEPLASSRIEALSLKEPQTGAAAVVLNATGKRRSNPLAARVDLAHELGHILFDPADREINLVMDEKTDEGMSMSHAEQRARAFAAELLIPAEGLRRLLGRPRYEMSMSQALALVEQVRREFTTPIEITVNHLFNREYIASWLREDLIEQARRHEPSRGVEANAAPVVPERDVLERRVVEALRLDLISDGRARELLQLSAWDELPMSEA
jgi:Zn-dependent peptidase ImmA (M78 family)